MTVPTLTQRLASLTPGVKVPPRPTAALVQWRPPTPAQWAQSMGLPPAPAPYRGPPTTGLLSPSGIAPGYLLTIRTRTGQPPDVPKLVSEPPALTQRPPKLPREPGLIPDVTPGIIPSGGRDMFTGILGSVLGGAARGLTGALGISGAAGARRGTGKKRRRKARLTASDIGELSHIKSILGKTAAANALPFYLGRR